jgi:hypothetical protein
LASRSPNFQVDESLAVYTSPAYSLVATVSTRRPFLPSNTRGRIMSWEIVIQNILIFIENPT